MYCVPVSTIAALLRRKEHFLNFNAFAHYSKRVTSRKYERFLGKLNKETETEAKNRLMFEEEEDVWTNFEKSDGFMDVIKEQDRKARIKKFKTIEKKYFKPPQEVNLLTFDAKEQIRYLHREFPEEWPVERLADSFPISKEGVVQLLRSNYSPESLKRLITHDRAVQRNWQQLTSGKEKDGPITLRYERLLKDGKLKNLQFAAGNFALPMPKRREIKSHNVEIDTSGLFASIVKDHVLNKQQKLKEVDQSHKEVKQIESTRTENIKQLSQITGISQYKLLAMGEKQSISSKLGYSKMFKYRDRNMTEENKTDFADNKKMMIDSNLRSIKEEVKMKSAISDYNVNTEDCLPPRKPLRRRTTFIESNNVNTEDCSSPRKPLRRRATFHERDIDFCESSLELPGKDTIQKDYRNKIQRENDNFIPSVENEARMSRDTNILNKIQYDCPTRQGETHFKNEAFIYDRDTGYQYPFGKIDPTTKDLEMSPKRNTGDNDSNKMYKKGNSYYDIDGEYLFKVP